MARHEEIQYVNIRIDNFFYITFVGSSDYPTFPFMDDVNLVNAHQFKLKEAYECTFKFNFRILDIFKVSTRY